MTGLLKPVQMGENIRLFYAVKKTNINQSKLNLAVSDRRKSERHTRIFLFGFG